MSNLVSELPTERTLRRLARFRAVRAGVLSLYLTFGPAVQGKRDIATQEIDARVCRLVSRQDTIKFTAWTSDGLSRPVRKFSSP